MTNFSVAGAVRTRSEAVRSIRRHLAPEGRCPIPGGRCPLPRGLLPASPGPRRCRGALLPPPRVPAASPLDSRPCAYVPYRPQVNIEWRIGRRRAASTERPITECPQRSPGAPRRSCGGPGGAAAPSGGAAAAPPHARPELGRPPAGPHGPQRSHPMI